MILLSKMMMFPMILLTICTITQIKAHPYRMPAANEALHIYALPVGQGDATVIQCPAGQGGLTIVDFGSSARQQKGIMYMTNDQIRYFLGGNVINYVYLTHGDKDHYNILPILNLQPNSEHLKGVAIGCTADDYAVGTTRGWLLQVRDQGKLRTFPANGCTTDCNSRIPICAGEGEGDQGVYMNVMGANLNEYDESDTCTNGDSLVIRLEYRNFKLLLPGDLEDYSGLRYDDNGYITSQICDSYGELLQGKPGNLRRLIDGWKDNGGIQADFYRLAHHGAYPNGNKEFFLNAIGVRYVFSSSKLPPSKFNHPNCDLYDLLINKIPTIETIIAGPMQQKQYSCGKDGERETEGANEKGVYTTAVCDTEYKFHNYIIKIDTDGLFAHWICPVKLAPSASMDCPGQPYEPESSHMEL